MTGRDIFHFSSFFIFYESFNVKIVTKKLSIHILSENMKIDATQNFQIQLHTSNVFNCLERFIHYEANIRAP